MILGIGHDLCNITRIEAAVARFGSRFISRVYTADEQAEYQARGCPARYLATRFAAKEAIYKALQRADQSGMSWQHAQTLSAGGAPCLSISGKCRDGLLSILPENSAAYLHVSITDDMPFASAYVVVEARPGQMSDQYFFDHDPT